jgi:hypothetical protein
MNVKDPILKKWVEENRETVLGQLVLYHSPVSLAEMVLNENLIDDKAVSMIKRRLEQSEENLSSEKKKRKTKNDLSAKGQKKSIKEKLKDDPEAEEKSKKVYKTIKKIDNSKGDIEEVFVSDDFKMSTDEDEVFDQF